MPWELPPSNLPTEDHLDMFIAGQAEEWLERYDQEEPFYLQVCFGGPHDPWDAPAEYRRRYDADAMSLSITDAHIGPVSPHVELLLKFAPQKLDRMSEAENRVMKSYYYAKVSLSHLRCTESHEKTTTCGPPIFSLPQETPHFGRFPTSRALNPRFPPQRPVLTPSRRSRNSSHLDTVKTPQRPV